MRSVPKNFSIRFRSLPGFPARKSPGNKSSLTGRWGSSSRGKLFFISIGNAVFYPSFHATLMYYFLKGDLPQFRLIPDKEILFSLWMGRKAIRRGLFFLGYGRGFFWSISFVKMLIFGGKKVKGGTFHRGNLRVPLKRVALIFGPG